ncbi:hypothetical protein KM915_21065 [Cytobacillus oceanisediminis]|uniref:hypothetical protein n=1 Tax=Cytobacillus oceanisediminis TaxID=665099 RepID=UPI001C22FAF4|nr:hypothetical protein [Cytobacillus oceanisediminis]MBU8732543.1 hypothetical protein [Cytobacillus oceanisediminis]
MAYSNKKFEEISQEIINLNIDEQRKFLYLLIGSTGAILEKEKINKADILLSYEVALKHFKKN